jgi:hypothetical protein
VFRKEGLNSSPLRRTCLMEEEPEPCLNLVWLLP